MPKEGGLKVVVRCAVRGVYGLVVLGLIVGNHLLAVGSDRGPGTATIVATLTSFAVAIDNIVQ
jgi:hypothetical protein